MMNDCLDAVVDELTAAGVKHEVVHGGKHLKILWTHDGLPRMYVVPFTPSDRRAHLNARSQVRGMLVRDGVVEPPGAEPVEFARVVLKEGLPFCSSLDIARHFDRPHKDVLRVIDRILVDSNAPEFNRRNFTPIDYVDSRGRKQRSFDLTRDGFSLVAMGFTGAAATEWKIKYIDAFNQMEAELRRLATTATIPQDVVQRIERLEGDLSALIDLSLAAPTPEPGYIIIKAHKRRVRRAA